MCSLFTKRIESASILMRGQTFHQYFFGCDSVKRAFCSAAAFAKNERAVFVIIIICVVASAFIINFSYGLYYNFVTQKSETELELKTLNPELAQGAVVTKGEFQKFAESLDEKTLNAMTVIYAGAELAEFESEAGPGSFPMRFVIHAGRYNICEVTRKNWEEKSVITSGRYINSFEEQSGELVAVVGGEGADCWNEACEKFRNADGSITMFGKKYKVVGTYSAGTAAPIVPFLTVPDNVQITQIGFSFERNITRSAYLDITGKADEFFHGRLKFPELKFPDSDSVSIYNNMIWIALLISLLSVTNFAMLYRFILLKRQRTLAVLRICGCSRQRAIATYFAECIVITLPAYALGAGVNVLVTEKVMCRVLGFFKEAYSLKTYLWLFAGFMLVFAVVVLPMISLSVGRKIEYKEKG